MSVGKYLTRLLLGSAMIINSAAAEAGTMSHFGTSAQGAMGAPIGNQECNLSAQHRDNASHAATTSSGMQLYRAASNGGYSSLSKPNGLGNLDVQTNIGGPKVSNGYQPFSLSNGADTFKTIDSNKPTSVNRIDTNKPTSTNRVDTNKPTSVGKVDTNKPASAHWIDTNKPASITNNINVSNSIDINKPVSVTKNINNSKNIEITNNINNSKYINDSKNINISKTIVINKGGGGSQSGSSSQSDAAAEAAAEASAVAASMASSSSNATVNFNSSGGASASSSAFGYSGAGNTVGGSSYMLEVPGQFAGGDLGNISVAAGNPVAAALAPLQCTLQDSTVIKAIHAVCLSADGHEFPASHMVPQTWINSSYEGEIARCIPGSHLKVVIGKVTESSEGMATRYTSGQVLECALHEAVRHYKDGLLKCAPAVAVPDCTERTNLRKYGTGDMFFTYRAKVCLETHEEYSANTSKE